MGALHFLTVLKGIHLRQTVLFLSRLTETVMRYGLTQAAAGGRHLQLCPIDIR